MREQFCGWCGKELVGKRPHAEYCDSSCRASATRWRQSRSGGDQETLTSAATPPIALIRADQEAAKDHWTTIVREGIIDRLRANPTQPFHADDLEPLGIPDEHRNLIGSQIAKLVNQKWMVECGRRKSTVSSRNGAKSNEYRLTELGRDRISGLDAGALQIEAPATTSSASVESGDGQPVEHPGDQAKASGAPNPPALDASPESLSLLAEPDPEAWAA